MKHRSMEPGTGFSALGSNSRPDWWRLIFCFPNASPRRPPAKVIGSIPITFE
jgi:hypothetical protein